ncbi:MAG: hypothetical protein ACP5MH_11620 [Thermoproteus sp.]
MDEVKNVAYVIYRMGIRAQDLLDPGDRGFETRLLVQKVVYFLQRLGLTRGYYFDLYLHGPYSTQLADDYMWLARKGDEYISRAAEECAECQKLDRWLEYLGKIDLRTLEVAATLAELAAVKGDLEEAEGLTRRIKPWVDDEDIAAALQVLRDLGLG